MQIRKHSHTKETYLLTGKMICGECGGSYVASRRARTKTKEDSIWVCYGCNKRYRTADHACRNKEVNKNQIEGFVLETLSRYVFSEQYIPKITAEYNA